MVRKSRHPRRLAPLLLSAFLAGCGGKVEGFGLLPVPIPLGVGLAATADNVLSLVIRTDRDFSCLGYHIVGNVRHSPAGVWVELVGIEPPHGACPTALGPATMEATLGLLAPGTYALGIFHGDRQATARLEVTDTTARIDGFDVYWITVETPEVRLPKGGDVVK